MLSEIRTALEIGRAIPYLGPGVLTLAGADCGLPSSPAELVTRLTASTSVPHKLRNNLTGAAQFIENFKHRRTVATLIRGAFAGEVAPSALHRFLAQMPHLKLLVHAWYDDLPQRAFAGRTDWAMLQGVSQAEHFGQWTHRFAADGTRADGHLHPVATPEAGGARAAGAPVRTFLYQPLGSVSPAANFLVSDSDFVEVLTEIDIQTPIPDAVKDIRVGRNFLFLGCRFATQLERSFAYQIMKRSSSRHWAVLPEPPTRNEARFLMQNNITRIEAPLAAFADDLMSMSVGRVGAASLEAVPA